MSAQQLIDTAETLVAAHNGLLAMDDGNPTCAQRFAAVGVTSTDGAKGVLRAAVAELGSQHVVLETVIFKPDKVLPVSSPAIRDGVDEMVDAQVKGTRSAPYHRVRCDHTLCRAAHEREVERP